MKAEVNWHFLPELPPDTTEVLLAIKYEKLPIMAYYNPVRREWYGSLATRDYMRDGFVESSKIECDFIYAWAELPENPEFEE